ncbi:hypothetical protein HF845_10905 [Cellulosimicrobium aquatile]|nr:hypothetical protein [Cellulosimicrobium aquatile]
MVKVLGKHRVELKAARPALLPKVLKQCPGRVVGVLEELLAHVFGDLRANAPTLWRPVEDLFDDRTRLLVAALPIWLLKPKG